MLLHHHGSAASLLHWQPRSRRFVKAWQHTSRARRPLHVLRVSSTDSSPRVAPSKSSWTVSYKSPNLYETVQPCNFYSHQVNFPNTSTSLLVANFFIFNPKKSGT